MRGWRTWRSNLNNRVIHAIERQKNWTNWKAQKNNYSVRKLFVRVIYKSKDYTWKNLTNSEINFKQLQTNWCKSWKTLRLKKMCWSNNIKKLRTPFINIISTLIICKHRFNKCEESSLKTQYQSTKYMRKVQKKVLW